MEHWVKSTTKGGADFPSSLSDLWVSALASGRYNDSNFITGVETDDLIISQATNKFMTVVLYLTDTYEKGEIFSLDLTNPIGDVYNHATELSTNTALTLVHTQSQSATNAGVYVGAGAQRGRMLHWSYCISTITPDTNTNADGTPIGQRIKLQVTNSLSDKDYFPLQSGRGFLKIIELGQGYDGVQIPRRDETCPSLFSSSFYSFISGSLVGLDEGLLVPRVKNYLLPGINHLEMSSLDDRLLLHRLLKTSWGKPKTDTVNSYSVVSIPNDAHSSFGLSAKVKPDYDPDLWFRNAGPTYTQCSSKVNYPSSTYIENDLLFQPDLLGFIDVKDIRLSSDKTTLFLKNQMPGAIETQTNQLYEFYRFAFSGISTTRQPLDNIKLSIVYNTLSLPFYSHCDDVVDGGLITGIVYTDDQDIYVSRFKFQYGYETSDAIHNLYDIYDATHNVYIKINV